MPRISITYKTYSYRYPTFSEIEFYQLKYMLDIEPSRDYFPRKNSYDYVQEFYQEFKWQIGITLGIGLIILAFDSKEPLIVLLPLILWLVFGGIVSIVNFTENFFAYNKYQDRLTREFSNFETYEQYLYFVKFISIKY